MDLNKLIQENLLISLILLIVPVVAVVWKVMDTLFIKPREFRIKTLEQNLDALRNEFLRIDRQIEKEPEQLTIRSGFVDEDQTNPSIAESSIVSSSNLRTLHDLYSTWKDKSLTDLQRKRFEENFSGKEVIWDVYVTSISEATNGIIYLGIAHDLKKFGSDTALAKFDTKDEEALALLNKGEQIKIKGTIDQFFLYPSLKNCKLVSRTK